MPINLDIDDPISVGHILLTLNDDGKLCSRLADANYMLMRELGARILQNSVDHLAEKLFHDYVQIEDEIVEDTNHGPLLGYTMQLHPVEDSHEVAVFQTAEDTDEADTLGQHFAGLSFENADAPKMSGSVIGQKRGLSDADESD
jgi:dsDNA-specific endonuclease/ATPase MutS2